MCCCHLFGYVICLFFFGGGVVLFCWLCLLFCFQILKPCVLCNLSVFGVMLVRRFPFADLCFCSWFSCWVVCFFLKNEVGMIYVCVIFSIYTRLDCFRVWTHRVVRLCLFLFLVFTFLSKNKSKGRKPADEGRALAAHASNTC